MSNQIFSQNFNNLICNFITELQEFLYILDTNPL